MRQLEFDAIIQLVGERVRALFAVQSAFIALHDPVTNLITFPYDIDEGVPFDRGSMPLGPGLTSKVIVTGRSLRIGSDAEQAAAGALQAGGADTISWLGAPITGANRVIGVLGLERLEEHAFTQADERVVSTLASSMGVRARERAPVRRDEAAARRGGRAGRRAAGDQRDRRGPGAPARLRRDHPARWRAGAHAVLRGVDVHRHPRPGHQPDQLSVRHRRGWALRSRLAGSSGRG